MEYIITSVEKHFIFFIINGGMIYVYELVLIPKRILPFETKLRKQKLMLKDLKDIYLQSVS